MLRALGKPRLAATARWQAMLGRYATVDLTGASECAVSDRIDIKFLLDGETLWSVLDGLGTSYRVLDIDGSRFTSYRTQYFDTETFALFHRHHAGGGNRYKVRARTYLNTGLSFVEIKRRNPSGSTSKVRQQTPEFATILLDDARDFVNEHCPHPVSSFAPTLLNSFDRVCLISKDHRERLTIDLDVAVEAPEGVVAIPNVAVAELKQERRRGGRRDSAFLRAMRSIRQRPTGFSKYCMGVLLTRPDIKHNLFMPQLKRLRRLTGELNVV